MTKLRLWIGGILVWLFVLYNIERIHEPINLASFVYVLCGIAATCVVVVPNLASRSTMVLMCGVVPLLVLLKALLGYPIFGAGLPFTITECCVLGVTLIMARQIGHAITEFQHNAAQVAVLQSIHNTSSFDSQQDHMYREVRRARKHDRPLTLVSIRASEPVDKHKVSELLLRIQRDTVQKYVQAQLVTLLSDETDRCAIIGNDDDTIHVMLPEFDHEQSHNFVEKIALLANVEYGVDIESGIATFPDEEITLSGLVTRTERVMSRVQEFDRTQGSGLSQNELLQN